MGVGKRRHSKGVRNGEILRLAALTPAAAGRQDDYPCRIVSWMAQYQIKSYHIDTVSVKNDFRGLEVSRWRWEQQEAGSKLGMRGWRIQGLYSPGLPASHGFTKGATGPALGRQVRDDRGTG